MNARTLGFFLIAIAFVSLLTELEWLFIAFIALGLSIILFYKDGDGKAEPQAEKTSEAKALAPPRVIIVQQDSTRSASDAVIEDIRLDQMTGRTRKIRKEIHAAKAEAKKETASLKKELDSLKKKLDAKKK
ncbi:hypothetical protein J4220_02415 [Candidatus Micrarchaeota archaeon]|nr:hypothetical protein [Candidatus Micrarchaeota archaeon]